MKGSEMESEGGDANRHGDKREVDDLITLKDPEHGGSTVLLLRSESG